MGCYVGHGFWGLMQKKEWVRFLEIFYFSPEASNLMMPVIGTCDILLGLVIFFRPNRALVIWAFVWTAFTACLRPSSGLGMSEFFERAGNFGVPLALLFLIGVPTARSSFWKEILVLPKLDLANTRIMEWILRISIFCLLAGHGGLAFFMQHKGLLRNLNGIGLNLDPAQYHLFGIWEMLLGSIVLLRPRTPGLLWFVLFYKLATEALFPIVGLPRDIFETIERMGDYIAPLALIMIYQTKQSMGPNKADTNVQHQISTL